MTFADILEKREVVGKPLERGADVFNNSARLSTSFRTRCLAHGRLKFNNARRAYAMLEALWPDGCASVEALQNRSSKTAGIMDGIIEQLPSLEDIAGYMGDEGALANEDLALPSHTPRAFVNVYDSLGDVETDHADAVHDFAQGFHVVDSESEECLFRKGTAQRFVDRMGAALAFCLQHQKFFHAASSAVAFEEMTGNAFATVDQRFSCLKFVAELLLACTPPRDELVQLVERSKLTVEFAELIDKRADDATTFTTLGTLCNHERNLRKQNQEAAPVVAVATLQPDVYSAIKAFNDSYRGDVIQNVASNFLDAIIRSEKGMGRYTGCVEAALDESIAMFPPDCAAIPTHVKTYFWARGAAERIEKKMPPQLLELTSLLSAVSACSGVVGNLGKLSTYKSLMLKAWESQLKEILIDADTTKAKQIIGTFRQAYDKLTEALSFSGDLDFLHKTPLPSGLNATLIVKGTVDRAGTKYSKRCSRLWRRIRVVCCGQLVRMLRRSRRLLRQSLSMSGLKK